MGTLLAIGLLHLLSAWKPFADLPIHVAVVPDVRVYFLALLLSVVSGALPGLLPIRRLWRTDLVQTMRSATAESAIGRKLSLRDLLLGVQVALCALLLTASLVALRGMGRSLHAPLGFNPQGVMLAETDLHLSNWRWDRRRGSYCGRLCCGRWCVAVDRFGRRAVVGCPGEQRVAKDCHDATPRDPLVWGGMAALGIAATWIPARRALRIDPAKLLKEDA